MVLQCERVWSGKLFLVFDLEVVEKGLEVILGCEACVKQETLDAGPFSEASVVEHLQVVVNALMINTCFRLKRTKLSKKKIK